MTPETSISLFKLAYVILVAAFVYLAGRLFIGD